MNALAVQAADQMTWPHLWPFLVVMGVGIVLLTIGATLYLIGGKDEDGDANFGCITLILSIIGVILIWKGADALTHLIK